jgi:O-Antigen ligase
VSPSSATLDRARAVPELTSSNSSKPQSSDVLLGRLAAASVACTPFWLPIVNDWHSWSTGLVVTLGEVPLIGFTLLAAPKTFRTIAANLPWHKKRAASDQAVEHDSPDRLSPDQQFPNQNRAGLDPYVLGLLSLFAALTLSAVVHPHIRGLQTLWRVLAMICLGEHVINRKIRATTIVHALIGITTFEAALAIWQRITHAPLGLGILGESPVPFYGFGNKGFAVNGTLPHPYPLAALALVGGSAAIVFGGRRLISSRVAALGAGTSAIIIGLTISRAGLLSAAGIAFGTFLSSFVAWRRRHLSIPEFSKSSKSPEADDHASAPTFLLRLVFLGIFVVGLISSMSASKDAWSNRAAIQQQGQSVNEMSSSRGDRLQEGIGVYKTSPIVGVGPGRYVIALAGRPELLHSDPSDALPAHNAALLLLAEGGIPTALALLAVSLVLGRRLLSLGADGIIMFSAVFPFLMLDIVFISLPSGLFLLGVWGALVSALIIDGDRYLLAE